MQKTQLLNSVLTLAGVKGDYALTAAVQSINTAAYHAIVDGNTRPFDETKAALPKGTTKDGNLANNQQGLVLGALLTAAKTSRGFFEQLHDNGGKLNKKLTADDKTLAVQYANGISDSFLNAYSLGLSGMKATRAAAAEKTKATKAEAAESAAKVEAIKAEEARIAEESKAADTFLISDLLMLIKGGNPEALEVATLISNALAQHKLGKANKAAAAATKREKASAPAVKIAA